MSRLVLFAFLSLGVFAHSVMAQKVTSKCLDFKKISASNQKRAVQLDRSLTSYMHENIPPSSKILAHIKGIAISGREALIVFFQSFEGANDGLRTAERDILIQNIAAWAKESKIKDLHFTVRFGDECEVPFNDVD